LPLNAFAPFPILGTFLERPHTIRARRIRSTQESHSTSVALAFLCTVLPVLRAARKRSMTQTRGTPRSRGCTLRGRSTWSKTSQGHKPAETCQDVDSQRGARRCKLFRVDEYRGKKQRDGAQYASGAAAHARFTRGAVRVNHFVALRVIQCEAVLAG
jgi:hypothetical protein